MSMYLRGRRRRSHDRALPEPSYDIPLQIETIQIHFVLGCCQKVHQLPELCLVRDLRRVLSMDIELGDTYFVHQFDQFQVVWLFTEMLLQNLVDRRFQNEGIVDGHVSNVFLYHWICIKVVVELYKISQRS